MGMTKGLGCSLLEFYVRFRAIAGVLCRLITKLVSSKVIARLMATINNRNAGFHAAGQPSGQ
jgi:hypothetical protein